MERKSRFIYVLVDPRSDTPFYVGSGTYGDRPTQHIDIALGKSAFRHNAEQESMYEFIREIVNSGYEVHIEIPYDNIEYEKAMVLEEELTRSIGTQYDGNGPLFNIKYGNKFPDGFRDGEKNSFYGKSHSSESLSKMRKPRNKSWTCSEETRRKRSENHRGPTKVKLYDKDMNFIAEFTQIKKCAMYLQRLYPDKPFSVSQVRCYSKTDKLMNGLVYIIRESKEGSETIES